MGRRLDGCLALLVLGSHPSGAVDRGMVGAETRTGGLSSVSEQRRMRVEEEKPPVRPGLATSR